MIKYLKNIIKLLALWPVYFIGIFIPKNQQVWCFGAPRERFVDNSKYMFLYVNKYYPKIKCYWITSDPALKQELTAQGFLVVNRNSLKGIWTILTAKVVFYSCFISEVSFWLTSGATAVNLWHGLPLKKIEFDIKSGEFTRKYSSKISFHKLGWLLFNPVSFRRPDMMFSPAPVFTPIFERAFRLTKGIIVSSGSPRTDIFFDKSLASEHLDTYPDIITAKNAKLTTFLYMPTFRDVRGDFFASAGFDFDLLNAKMAEIKGVFYIKVHPNAGLNSFCLDNYDNIKIVPASADPYPLMSYVDVLVTDYSSIYIDFLLLDKPIVFFAFDLPHYLATCRDMYFDYEKVTPGRQASDFQQLLASLDEADTFSEQRLTLKQKFWGNDYLLGYQTIADKLIKENS
jgi:CDP-glycerol glycerophosphotransferase (TagB/SpsB family)